LKSKFLFPLVLFCLFINFSCKYFVAKDDKDFAVADTASIQKIFIADKNNHKILLTRDKNCWKVNNNYTARKDAIDLLLGCITAIRVNRPVSISENDVVVKDMAASALKVEIYTHDEKPEKVYYVGSPGKDYQGNYFLMEGSQQPYIVEIPGFNGVVDVRYIIEESDWRDRAITNLKPTDLKAVSVEYFDERRKESYGIEQKNLNEYFLFPNANTDNKKCFELFSQFRKLNMVGYVNEKYDSMVAYKNRPPFAIIRFQLTNNSADSITLIHVPLGRRSRMQYDPNGKPMSFDSENYYAWVHHHQDFVVIQDFALRNILKQHKDFLK
jgi:Domain of unknown function (DUF4340)